MHPESKLSPGGTGDDIGPYPLTVPQHPRCRCALAPIDDEWTSIEEWDARDRAVRRLYELATIERAARWLYARIGGEWVIHIDYGFDVVQLLRWQIVVPILAIWIERRL